MSLTYENGVYSFQDVNVNLTGPNISVDITGIAEEGVAVEWEGDKDTLTMGAGGGGMHSLRAAQNGMMTVRLLKTSPYNAALANAFNYQTLSAANHGQNTILIDDLARGDTLTGLGAAFRRIPTITFATIGGINEWVFNCVRIDLKLGRGVGGVIVG